jgi:hypothetical protein
MPMSEEDVKDIDILGLPPPSAAFQNRFISPSLM